MNRRTGHLHSDLAYGHFDGSARTKMVYCGESALERDLSAARGDQRHLHPVFLRTARCSSKLRHCWRGSWNRAISRHIDDQTRCDDDRRRTRAVHNGSAGRGRLLRWQAGQHDGGHACFDAVLCDKLHDVEPQREPRSRCRAGAGFSAATCSSDGWYAHGACVAGCRGRRYCGEGWGIDRMRSTPSVPSAPSIPHLILRLPAH